MSGFELFCMITAGLAFALFEALDFDVLIGLLIWPITKLLSISAAVFDTESIDPAVWMAKLGEAYSHLCREAPSLFVGAVFGLFALFALAVLFEADFSRWRRESELRAQGYKKLEVGDDGPTDEGLESLYKELDEDGGGSIDQEELASAIKRMFGDEIDPEVIDELLAAADTDSDGEVDLDEFKAIMRAGHQKFGGITKAMLTLRAMTDVDSMQSMLRNAKEEIEEVELVTRLHGDGLAPALTIELSERRARLVTRIRTLNEFVSAMDSGNQPHETADLTAAAREAEQAELQRKRVGSFGDYVKLFTAVVKRFVSGVLTVYLYFMDLISDYSVTKLFYETHAWRFALVSAGLIIGQFVVIWLRVLPYLQVTYGSDSTFYRLFLYLGLPFGCFFFDFLMFLGPFGLLSVMNLPESMFLFIPAYGATRMIAEVAVEAFPQWVMQSIIFVMVSQHVKAGTASGVDMALYHYDNGSFVSLMPQSILISSLTMLKTWYDLVQEARQAGISVSTKAAQLWNVGYGLPLDAIKKSRITAWKCQYEISDQEVISLVDALGKNDSLTWLDLSLAGLEWVPTVQREERSAISTLAETINGNPKALESLQKLIVSQTSQWEIPLSSLRSGPETALKALSEAQFLSEGGPGREDLHAIFEILGKNRSAAPGDDDIELSFTAVQKVFADAAKPGVASHVKRATWQASVARLMTQGICRRAHFKVVLSAEVLHNLGYRARELHDLGFSPRELRAGLYTARELKGIGLEPAALKRLGYSAAELRDADVSAEVMRALKYTARQLRSGGYTARELSPSYSLIEMKEGLYRAAEVADAGYQIGALFAAKFTALDLRKALIFSVSQMRGAGYTATDMKKAGFDAKRLHEAQYPAAEALDAGFTAAQLYAAGYYARELRSAGLSALALREAVTRYTQLELVSGYDLDALRDADYSAEELNQAGYSAQELKEAGTSLVQLKVAGTPMAKLKQAGYSTLRLKTQQYTTAELAFGARNRVDLRSLGAWYEPIRPWYEKADPPPGLFGKTESESSSGQEINFETFCELMRAREGSKTLSLSVLRQRFAKLDIDGGGTVSHSEFEAGIILDALSQNDPMKLIAAMDTDGNQAIDQSEFARAVRLTKGCQAVADTSIVLAFNALDQDGSGELDWAELRAKLQPEVLGASTSQLRKLEVTALPYNAGNTAKELRGAGVTAKDLRRAKVFFRVEEWKDAGWHTRELHESGYTAKELMMCGFTAEELHRQSYSVSDLMAGDVTAKDLYALHVPASELKAAGIAVWVCSQAGYSARELVEAGFSSDDIMSCGYGAKALREAGVGAIELRKLGFTPLELRECGYDAAALKEAGYAVKELHSIAFDVHALRAAGFTEREVDAVSRPLEDLKLIGYTAAELRAYGFVVVDLRTGSYTVKEMKEGGFSLAQLSEGGVPTNAVRAVDGRTVKELRGVGFHAAFLANKVGYELYDLVEGGYTATELREAHFDATVLKDVGFTAGSLRTGGFNSRQLHGARYKLREMQEGGVPWQDLVIFLKATHAELTKAGYANLDPHHELFLLYRPGRADDDETIPEMSMLSPRLSPGRSGAPGRPPSPHEAESPRVMEVTDQYLRVDAETPIQVRRGASLTSKRAGVLSKGTKLRVVDSRIWRGDGTQRLCVHSAEPEAQSQTQLPIGWVSARPGFFSACTHPDSPNQDLVQPERLPKPQNPTHWQNDMEC